MKFFFLNVLQEPRARGPHHSARSQRSTQIKLLSGQLGVCVCVCVTFLPPGEQVSGGGVLVIFRGLEPQLEGEEPRILIGRNR